MGSEIVPIRGGLRTQTEGRDEPPANNIPLQLRGMADQIEGGEYQGCGSLIVVMPMGEDYPAIFGWGDVEGRNLPVIQLELARAWFISQAFGGSGWRV